MIKSLIVGLCLLLPTLSNSQIIQHQIGDDGYVRVPLQFPFPYHGRVFTESFMFSNGVVGFLNPTNSWCCTGFNLETSRGSPFDYAIMPLQTDLLNYNGRFLTEGTPQYQRYGWENISEYGVPGNLNTFGVEIRPSGYIGMHYEKVNISPWRPVTIGMTGDTSVGEFTQQYHGAGFSSNEIVSYITQSTGDRCLSEPLSSIGCPGYAQAYLAQQCTISALYDSSCPGYTQAYFTQQCSLNALYDSNCPGYAEAYFNQQCSNNALYDRRCPGYQEAYALANIVPAPRTVVSAPVLQVSTTGTVAIETPVVSDPVVNEVITRPTTQTNNATNTQSNTVQSSPAQAEPKAEKKSEPKQAPRPTATAKGEIPTQTIPQPVHEYKAPVILDLAYQQLVKKPIKDNNRAMYHLIMNSQIKHEEMIDEQYRRK
jgi:hypothetical protein